MAVRPLYLLMVRVFDRLALLAEGDMNARPPQLSARLVRNQQFFRSMRMPRDVHLGGFDVHRRQITFDYVDTDTDRLQRGRIGPARWPVLRRWLAERVELENWVAPADLQFHICSTPTQPTR